MKKFTISCIALAMVAGACLTAEAQNYRNRQYRGNYNRGNNNRSQQQAQHHRGIGNIIDHFKDKHKKKQVYDVTIRVQKFRGYKWVNTSIFDTSAKPLTYSVSYGVQGGGQRVAGTDNINSAVRMRYYNINGGTKTLRGLAPDTRLNFSSYASVSNSRVAGPPSQTKVINPNGETVWLNGKDYQIAVSYTVTKRKVR